MTDFAQLFYRMLPGIYRQKDASGQLQQFLSLMADPASELEQSIGQLYLDLYVESCRPEFLPFIGDVIGADVDPADPASVQRATLAAQFAFYRSKGLALPLAQVVQAISTWSTVTVDFSQVVARLPFVEALNVIARRRAVAVAEASPSSGRFYFNVADAGGQTVTPLYDELRGRPIARTEIVTLASEVIGTDFGFNIYDRGVALIGSNTSSISITRLAAATDRPEKFIGIHFMNPVPRMELVELVRGIATEDATFDAAREFVTKLGKQFAVAEDFPAFIVNRMLMPMINEAIYTLYEGVGNVEAIDAAMKLGAHHPMGPLELADFIGLDICLAIMQVLHEGLADSKYRPCPLLVKYVEAGWLGRKSGRGFYDYRGDKPVPTR